MSKRSGNHTPSVSSQGVKSSHLKGESKDNLCCELHHIKRYDKIEHLTSEPSHYPKGMISLYKNDFSEKPIVPNHYEPVSDNAASRFYRNPIVGGTHKRPKLEGASVMQQDFKKVSLSNNHWQNDNKERDNIDHLNTLTSDNKNNKTTEYREFLRNNGKDSYSNARLKQPKAEPKERMEKRTVYNKDYTAQLGTKGYINPKIGYEDNLKIVRSSFSANNIGVGHTYVHPAKDQTTYHDYFNKKREDFALTFGAGAKHSNYAQPTVRPNALNNWSTAHRSIQKNTVYKQNFVNQHVVNCTCGNH